MQHGSKAVDTCEEKYPPAVTCHERPDGFVRFYLVRHWPLSSITLKRRKSWLLAASALASSSLGILEPALAQNECGPLVGGSVTCTSAGNNYPGGISYLQTTPATDLHVTLDSNVNVTFSGAQPAAVIVDNRGGNAELTANGAAITANVPGVNGLVATTDNGSGNAIITASGPIQVVGNGIVAIARGGGGVVNAMPALTDLLKLGTRDFAADSKWHEADADGHGYGADSYNAINRVQGAALGHAFQASHPGGFGF
jgi:hypothetical protein